MELEKKKTKETKKKQNQIDTTSLKTNVCIYVLLFTVVFGCIDEICNLQEGVELRSLCCRIHFMDNGYILLVYIVI